MIKFYYRCVFIHKYGRFFSRALCDWAKLSTKCEYCQLVSSSSKIVFQRARTSEKSYFIKDPTSVEFKDVEASYGSSSTPNICMLRYTQQSFLPESYCSWKGVMGPGRRSQARGEATSSRSQCALKFPMRSNGIRRSQPGGESLTVGRSFCCVVPRASQRWRGFRDSLQSGDSNPRH